MVMIFHIDCFSAAFIVALSALPHGSLLFSLKSGLLSGSILF